MRRSTLRYAIRVWIHTDPRFALPHEPPFPPGTSPFHTLGVAYTGLMEFVAKQVPGGVEAFRRALPTPGLQRFFEQSFSSSRNYDVVPLPYAGVTIARLRGIGFVDQIREANRIAARAGFARAYSALLRTIRSDTLVLALPRAAAVLHDFGKVQAEAAGDKCVQGARIGVPHVLVAWTCISASGFIESLMEDGGARETRMTFLEPEPIGNVGGQVTYRIPFRLEWR
jgi:hypothetical protein